MHVTTSLAEGAHRSLLHRGSSLRNMTKTQRLRSSRKLHQESSILEDTSHAFGGFLLSRNIWGLSSYAKVDAFELWCWRRLLRVLWTARRSNQFIFKEINPEYSLEGLRLKLKLRYFGRLM